MVWDYTCKDNPANPGCNSCRTSSPYLGCNDPFCESRICGALNQTQCCQDVWDDSCAAAASVVCRPEVTPIYDAIDGCPLGYICDEDTKYKTSCSEIREVPIDFAFGDYFGGVYCPAGIDHMRNCPKGYYCPTPAEKYPCPEGKYCPYKVTEPWINCPLCEEGATEIRRDYTGPIIIGIGLIIAIVLLILNKIRRRYKDAFDANFQLLGKQAGMLKQTFANKEKRNMERLEKLKPKLKLILKRLKDEEEDEGEDEPESAGSTFMSSASFMINNGDLDFDSRTLFDILDTNGDGVLDYSEINTIMQLDEEELRMFVSSMAGGKDMVEVSRPVFVKNFLTALEGAVTMKVSPEEAEETYEGIVVDSPGKILYDRMLPTSLLANFLTEIEIFKLRKKFQSIHSIDHESIEELKSTRRGVHGISRRGIIISKEDFVKYYPVFLFQILSSQEDDDEAASNEGVDICFQNLCLEVQVAKAPVNVVDNVTGRIRAKTMTALMGGSGAGKTSLLNALCGRAHYGEVLGDIHINGKNMAIEEIMDVTGFVPQDDIVYAELTVRENFLFAGKLRLPKGTSIEEIEDLAEKVLANLGLSRVADSLVGDVKRRGVSGGEKKRVNIGLELMARPSCLFLDEPTSGLDSSSALVVMSSLENLVRTEGVTIVSVIHQPRKFIFDLFDSLVLLGAGGRIVYHGRTSDAQDYFSNLEYVLPQGEALADWLIDISSGRIHPEPEIAATKALEAEKKKKKSKGKKKKKKKKKRSKAPPKKDERGVQWQSSGLSDEDNDSDDPDLSRPRSSNLSDPDQARTNFQFHSFGVGAIATKRGVTTGIADEAITDAALRRQILYEEWEGYFKRLPMKDREMYDVPEEFKLPSIPQKTPFLSQFYHQLSRASLVSRRNGSSKLFDTTILIVAIIVLTLVSGLPELTRKYDPSIPFASIVNPTEDSMESMTGELFRYATSPQVIFPLQVGIVTSVLVGLQSSKILTSKMNEFFREASSGYNINAYFLAVNVLSVLETSIQMILVAFTAGMLREPVASWGSFYVHFLTLAWSCVSWALLFPMFVPADNVGVFIGFWMVFFGLLLSGAVPPITFKEIYTGDIMEHLAAWFSPTRFFLEGLAVGEYRCLPPQSGWTVLDESVNNNRFDYTLMHVSQFSFAMHDANATKPSCMGYYWGVLPSIFVGITVRYAAFLAMHSFNRAKQTKRSLYYTIKNDRKNGIAIACLLLVLLCMIGFTTWLYTRDIDPDYMYDGIDDWKETKNNSIPVFNLTSPILLHLNEEVDATAILKASQQASVSQNRP